jgi:hypothetical protein
VDKLQKAIEGNKVVKIIYHAGSRSGTMREIIPRSITGYKLLAHCVTSGLEKTFFIDKVEVIDDDNQEVNEDDDISVISAFGKCMEEDNGGFSTIKDVVKLPYQKEVILKSICRQFPIKKNYVLRDHMKAGLLYLASYQEGVGVEDLHPGGFDFSHHAKDLDKFSKEEQLKFTEKLLSKMNFKEIDEQKKKYDRFNKLCEEDQKIFYDKIGCSLPFNHPLVE